MDKETFLKACEGAGSKKEIALNLKMDSGRQSTRKINFWLKEFEMDLKFPHRNGSNPRIDEEIFKKGVFRKRGDLHPRMIAKGIKNECSLCSLGPFWQNKELVLQVDHIDGDKTNNEFTNLRLLCPNCHSQCETSFNRNTRKVNYQFFCCDCGTKINSKSKRCSSCRQKYVSVEKLMPISEEKILFPSVDEVIDSVIQNGGWLSASRILGIGDNTLRKYLKRNGVDPKSIKYNRALNGDRK